MMSSFVEKIKEDNKEHSDSDESINSLLTELLELDEEQLSETVNDLDEEQYKLLYKKLNRYKNIGEDDGSAVCFSLYNLTEKYYEKLMTTSLIGFLYRSLHEYTLKPEDLKKQVKKDDFVTYDLNPNCVDLTVAFGRYTQLSYNVRRSLDDNFKPKDEVSAVDSLRLYVIRDVALNDAIKVLPDNYDFSKSEEFENLLFEKYNNFRYQFGIINMLKDGVKDDEFMSYAKDRFKRLSKSVKYKPIDYAASDDDFLDKLCALQEKTKQHLTFLKSECYTDYTKYMNDNALKKFLEIRDRFEYTILLDYYDVHAKIEAEYFKLKDFEKVKNERTQDYEKGLHEQLELESGEDRKIIMRFLSRHLKYNPDDHISKIDTDSEYDQERNKVVPSDKPIEKMTETELLHTEIPPNDWYGRFHSYYETNYEVLRQCTDDIYGIKSDIEFAINIYDKFNNTDDAEKFIMKHKDTVTSNIYCTIMRRWTLLGAFKKNNERIDYYNKETQILKDMMDKQTEDESIRKDLLDNRVKKLKNKNISIYGEHAKEFKAHKSGIVEQKSKYFDENDKIEEVAEGIKVTKEIEYYKDDGVVKPIDEALEVDVFQLNPKKKKMIKSTMHVKPSE